MRTTANNLKCIHLGNLFILTLTVIVHSTPNFKVHVHKSSKMSQ